MDMECALGVRGKIRGWRGLVWKGVWRDFPDRSVWDEGEWNYGVMESWYDGMMKLRNQRKEIW